MGYVYKITNTINNKAYIGISINDPKKRRIREHLSGHGSRLIAQAVKKYGKDAFTHEILEENIFDELMPDLEVAYIAEHNTIAPNGYNLDTGGTHAIPSDEARRKRSESMKGEKNPNFGKKMTADARRKISEANKGENNYFYGKKHNAETRRKMSEARRKSALCRGENHPFYGKKFSEEHRHNLSKARSGKNHYFYGKKHNAETRRKISQANKGKKYSPETRRKISQAKRHPDYNLAHSYLSSLPPEMSSKQKRQCLYNKFPHIKKATISYWVRNYNPK